MMNDPIVVWPPGTFYSDCGHIGNYFECTWDYPDLAAQGFTVCCLAW